MRAGRRALVLVPEIALTPGVAAAFRARFGERVAIQHSGLSDGERHDQWQRIRRGDVDVVVGHALRRLRAAPRHRAHRRRRGARRLVQAGREPALQRARRRDCPRPPPGRTGGARFRHALDGVLRAREARPVRAAHARAPRDGPAAGLGPHRQHAGGVRGGRSGADYQPRARRGGRGPARTARAGADPPQPARLLDVGVLPAVRRDDGMPELFRVARGARARAGGLPLLQLMRARCRGPASTAGDRSSNCSAYGTERVEAEVRRLFPLARVARLDRDTARRKGARGGDAGALRRRRARRPRRHADDCEGARLSARDPRRRDLRRRRPRTGRLPGVGAHVPAADAGGRAGRPGRGGGRGHHSDRLPGALQHRAGVPPGLPRRFSSRSSRSGARCATRPSSRSSTAS